MVGTGLPIMTIKEQRLLKQRMQAWDFKTGNWAAKPPLTRQEEIDYRMLHHNVTALYYVAHQNIKTYKILYPLCALAQLGVMVALCATVTPAPVKIASMIALPLSAASVMCQKTSAIRKAKQAKKECHHLLSRFDTFDQMPSITAPFEAEYPAMVAQTKTIRAGVLRLNPVRWRYVADIGNDLWKKERQRG